MPPAQSGRVIFNRQINYGLTSPLGGLPSARQPALGEDLGFGDGFPIEPAKESVEVTFGRNGLPRLKTRLTGAVEHRKDGSTKQRPRTPLYITVLRRTGDRPSLPTRKRPPCRVLSSNGLAATIGRAVPTRRSRCDRRKLRRRRLCRRRQTAVTPANNRWLGQRLEPPILIHYASAATRKPKSKYRLSGRFQLR
jgi:hypothetical protein